MITLPIVKFCAEECRRQQSGELSVANMIQAWTYAKFQVKHGHGLDLVDFILLGKYVEPVKNKYGFRKTPVVVQGQTIPWEHISRTIDNLVKIQDKGLITADEWFKEFEEIHPFVDGNGRVGQILYNWLKGTLDAPEFAPNFWS